MRLVRPIVLAAALTGLVFTAGAAAAAPRFRISPMFGGQPVAGARVCFSRALSSERKTVLDHLVSGPETRCQPADKVLAVPAGVWHLFVVADDPYLVSTHPLELVFSSASSNAEEIHSVGLEMVPAATIDVSDASKLLRAGESIALYIRHLGSDVSAPALVPIAAGTTEQAVPRRSAVVPLILRKSEIVAVGEEIMLQAGEREVARFLTTTAPTLVVPFRIVDVANVSERPAIRVIDRRADQTLMKYVPERAEWRGLVFVKNMRPAPVNVIIDSSALAANGVAITVPTAGDHQVITTDDVLIRATHSATSIRWQLDQTFAADLRTGRDCPAGHKPARVPHRLRAFRCGEKPVVRPSDLVGCTLIHEQALSTGAEGEAKVPLPAGDTVFELSTNGISARERAFVNEDKPTIVSIALAPSAVIGRVLLRDQPVLSNVRCGGPELATDEAGYFRCWRPTASYHYIEVTPCDGSEPYTYEFDPNISAVDVRIPSNTLRVTVRDATARSAVANAAVRLWNGRITDDPEPDSVELGATDVEGELRQTRVQPRKGQTICAMKRGYMRACREDFEIKLDVDQVVELTLTPATEVSGRIVGVTDVVDGRLFVTTAGVVLENAAVNRDGTFRLNRTVPPGAVVVLTSQNLSLCTLAAAPSEDGELRLRMPIVRPVSFTVSSTGRRTPFTIEIGGVLISSVAFAQHQMSHHEQYVVTPGRPVAVSNVDSSGGLVVVVGAVGRPGDHSAGDPAALPRYPVRGGSDVTVN